MPGHRCSPLAPAAPVPSFTPEPGTARVIPVR